jgi:hypothetical protein
MSEFLVTIRNKKAVGQGNAVEVDNVLKDFLAEVQKNRDVSIKNGTDRSILVIEGTEDAVKSLKSQFGDQLIIEPNSELKMF